MSTATPAAVTPSQVVFCSEDHQAVGIEIEIARRDCSISRLSPLHKLGNALSANAGTVFQFRRDPREQFFWDGHARTPAVSFMTGNPAELTVIRATALRANLRLKRLLAKILVHRFAFR